MSLDFTHIKGDTFYKVPFEIKKNGVAIDLTDAVIRMQLRSDYERKLALNLTSVNDDGITITDASNGLFEINEQIIDINAGTYKYDIEVEINGTIKTWVKGDFIVTPDVTKKQ